MPRVSVLVIAAGDAPLLVFEILDQCVVVGEELGQQLFGWDKFGLVFQLVAGVRQSGVSARQVLFIQEMNERRKRFIISPKRLQLF